MREILLRCDEHHNAAWALTIGINPFAEDGLLPDPSLVRARGMLPVRFRGLGVVSTADIAHAAFVGAMELVVPRFASRVDAAGNRSGGLFPQLGVVTGDAFGASMGRWSALLATDLPMATSFRASWETMRTEAGARPGTVFFPPATDAPGRPHADDAPPPGGSKPRLQRLCTRELARTRAAAVATRMQLLPENDMRAIAFEYAANGVLFFTLPQATTFCSKNEFAGAVAVYLGLEDPLVVAAIAAKGPGPHYIQDACALRLLDPYGSSLSMYMGKGHGRTRFHDDIQRSAASLGRAVGLQIREVPGDLFLAAIPPRHRDNYLQSTGRDRGANRGGVVPDLYESSSKQMYDVKTTGFTGDDYISGRLVVELKAATVEPQYKRRAAAADVRFNETLPGAVGPVAAMLAALPVVQCISVGAFGEINRATQTFLATIAEAGSNHPERFGCCHGKVQARGVIAQWAWRHLGRVLLRGVVRVRHTALTATMTTPGTGGPAAGLRRAETPIWNEWDTGNRSWVPQHA